VENAPTVQSEPATPPQASDVTALFETPVDVAEPVVSRAVDTPVAPSVGTEAPLAPSDADAVVIDTQPAAPVSVDVAEAEPVLEVEPETVEAVEVEADQEIAPEAPVEEASVADVVEPATEAPTQDVLATDEPVEAAPEEEVVTAEVVTEVPVEEEDVAAAPAPATVEPDVAPQTPAAVVEQTQEATALPTVNTGVRVNRPGTDPTETAGQDAVVVEAEPTPDDAPALSRYAALFENPDDLPMISIILVDEGTMPDAASAISDLGFLPTVAVNALANDAASQMTAYRSAGIEVALQTSLPDGARPTDVEVAFEAAFGILPEAAMLFSDGTGVLQDDRSVTSQVMEILAADGRGFVTVQRGLGNAVRAAEQANVLAATIIRDLDGEGEDQAAIARALDQAAFRARQSGGAILMGRVTPATLDALRAWAGNLDASQLAIAPVSAILLDQAE
jgi:polysaccharide deacetylase 2 family uncharacterized protein YibQ